jgi:two-component system chemotaxis sensor kinase CheA
VIEIVDDGRGIDWPRVALKAAELGLPADTEQDFHAALFLGGVSTASHVTDISGRGIGMGALRVATLALGGEMEIETELGRGTTLRMVFPQTAKVEEVGSVTGPACSWTCALRQLEHSESPGGEDRRFDANFG